MLLKTQYSNLTLSVMFLKIRRLGVLPVTLLKKQGIEDCRPRLPIAPLKTKGVSAFMP